MQKKNENKKSFQNIVSRVETRQIHLTLVLTELDICPLIVLKRCYETVRILKAGMPTLFADANALAAQDTYNWCYQVGHGCKQNSLNL